MKHQDSGTNEIISIYVQLLDEGSFLARRASAISLGGGRYRVLPTSDYNPEEEVWEFPPESVIRLRKRWSDGEGDYLLAVADTDSLEILVLFRDGNIDNARSMDAVPLGNDLYKILPTYHYTREEDQLEFQPGDAVRLRRIHVDGKEKLLAVR